MIDLLFIIILSIVTKILLYNTIFENYFLLITLTIFYVFIPTFTSGKTFGKRIIKLQISGNESKISWYKILIRNVLLVYIVLYPFCWINILNDYIPIIILERIKHIIIACQIINVTYYIYTVLCGKQHLFIYEALTGTKNISTISVEKKINMEEKEKISEQKKENYIV